MTAARMVPATARVGSQRLTLYLAYVRAKGRAMAGEGVKQLQ